MVHAILCSVRSAAPIIFAAFQIRVIVHAPGKRFYPEDHLRAKWASDLRVTLE
jgi:hypothetical protein